MTLRFTIPVAPVTKKNHQRIIRLGNRPALAQSKQYQDYEKTAAFYVPKVAKRISDPVEVIATFYMKTRRRVDLTNLLEALDDVLVCAKLLEDDNCLIIVSHDGSRVAYDKDHPRTEVLIRSYKGELPW